MSRNPLNDNGRKKAVKAARERILAGHADREAALRYRSLVGSGNVGPETSADYLQRATECDRMASIRLKSRMYS